MLNTGPKFRVDNPLEAAMMFRTFCHGHTLGNEVTCSGSYPYNQLICLGGLG